MPPPRSPRNRSRRARRSASSASKKMFSRRNNWTDSSTPVECPGHNHPSRPGPPQRRPSPSSTTDGKELMSLLPRRHFRVTVVLLLGLTSVVLAGCPGDLDPRLMGGGGGGTGGTQVC